MKLIVETIIGACIGACIVAALVGLGVSCSWVLRAAGDHAGSVYLGHVL